jgi:two-component system phosphate regulon sensor histidine kinase PhoR
MYIILRQKRLSELQKDFINNMTHEFKTPISTIRISSEVLQKDPYIVKNDRLSRYTKIISEQNNRLNEQVEKVLQLAQIERGSFKINPKPLDLHEIILNLLPSLQVKVQEEEGTLDTALDAVRTRIDADPLHLQNVIQNLIDNGVKYCRETPQITLSTVNEGKHILLTIRDEGIGIPKDLQGQVFSKFYRIPTGNVHNVKGFGLGLYYVKSVCDSHHWEINLDSEPQSFSSFTIKIPLL